jgi:hypothetical protein
MVYIDLILEKHWELIIKDNFNFNFLFNNSMWFVF